MIEILISECLASFPFRVLAYIPFREHLRVRFSCVLAILIATELAGLGVMKLLTGMGVPQGRANAIFMPMAIVIFFTLVTVEKGKIAFIYVFVTSYVLMVRGISGYISLVLFGKGQGSWQYGISVFLIFCLTVPFVLYYIDKTAQLVFQTCAPLIWRTAWISPLVTLVIVMLFTYGKEHDLRALMARSFLIICTFFSYYYVIGSVRDLQKRLEYENHIQYLEEASAIQSDQYRMIKKHMEEVRRARHDLRQHLVAIEGYISRGSSQALAEYVENYRKSLPEESIYTFCQNYAVNAILNYYAQKAEEQHVRLEAILEMGEETIIPEPGLCVILGNLLENALDACEKVEGERFIRLKASQTGDSMLFLTVDNTSPQPPRWKGERLLSEKREGFGIGTESAGAIARQYNGSARFEWREGIFYASVMLNP